MPGTICVLSGELSRYATFSDSLVRLMQVHHDDYFDHVMGKGIVQGQNESIGHFMRSPGEWWFLLGDDHAFESQILTRLLARQVPICAALNVQRHKPFNPLLYSAAQVGGPPVHQYTWKHLAGHRGLYKLPHRDSCGNNGMLIRREVLEALGGKDGPWIMDRPGQPFSEDLYFCERVRALGYDIHIDMDCRMGHSFVSTAIPIQSEDGQWLVALQANQDSYAYIRY